MVNYCGYLAFHAAHSYHPSLISSRFIHQTREPHHPSIPNRPIYQIIHPPHSPTNYQPTHWAYIYPSATVFRRPTEKMGAIFQFISMKSPMTVALKWTRLVTTLVTLGLPILSTSAFMHCYCHTAVDKAKLKKTVFKMVQVLFLVMSHKPQILQGWKLQEFVKTSKRGRIQMKLSSRACLSHSFNISITC